MANEEEKTAGSGGVSIASRRGGLMVVLLIGEDMRGEALLDNEPWPFSWLILKLKMVAFN